jgi:DNA invertase Pin-like site-specific DNA recombinase
MTVRSIRCAIYTRKSTEEGLDQAFNSLDAQREACEAYILSQAGEGWRLVCERYDDGGYSGGNMERPALARLLADIDKGNVDVVVVYKIDRLTRSLRDFAKIVDQLEKQNAFFVSVTQAFNTTTSMGRLTLNVLLSFAQFEREITAERIRDKISASRKRGIFMGGCPPLGYDVKDRKLVINEEEAETVRFIFKRYLEVSGIVALRTELDEKNIRTKSWISTQDRQIGGGRWYIGPLRYILHNRVYIGEAVHKGVGYPGEHEPILPRELFDVVQHKLDAGRVSFHRRRTVGSHGLLTGLIFDDKDNAMSPKRSYSKGRSQHLYYVSQARIQNRASDALRPIPGQAIEQIVRDRLNCIVSARRPDVKLQAADAVEISADARIRNLVRKLITRVEVNLERIIIAFNADAIVSELGVALDKIAAALAARFPAEDRFEQAGDRFVLTIPVRLKLRGGTKHIEGWDQSKWTVQMPERDANLIRALALAHEWRELIEAGHVVSLEGLAALADQDRKHLQRILRLAFLAPDIQKAILTGIHARSLSLTALINAELPMHWSEQRELLGMQLVAV